jgi:hypothetical protein
MLAACPRLVSEKNYKLMMPRTIYTVCSIHSNHQMNIETPEWPGRKATDLSHDEFHV